MEVSISFAVHCGGRNFTVGKGDFPLEACVAAGGLGAHLDLEMWDAAKLMQESRLAFEIPAETPVRMVAELFLSNSLPGRSATERFPGSPYVVAGPYFAYVIDDGMSLAQIRDALGQGAIRLYLLISGDAGEVLRGKVPKTSFSIHSNEAGSHNLPHVHVCYDHWYKWSMSIQTGEVLAGQEDFNKIPGKIRRQIVQKVRENASELMDYWNHRTNGLVFDIDASLGQIDCSELD